MLYFLAIYILILNNDNSNSVLMGNELQRECASAGRGLVTQGPARALIRLQSPRGLVIFECCAFWHNNV